VEDTLNGTQGEDPCLKVNPPKEWNSCPLKNSSGIGPDDEGYNPMPDVHKENEYQFSRYHFGSADVDRPVTGV